MIRRVRGNRIARLRTLVAGGAVVVAAALGGCEGSSLVEPPDGEMPFSGQDLFRGILLLHGPVAEELPETRRWAPAPRVGDRHILEGYDAFVFAVLHSVDANLPGYFDRFRADIVSGERLRIQRALNEARLVILEHARTIPEIQRARQFLRENPRKLDELVARGGTDAETARALFESIMKEPAQEVLLEPSTANMEGIVFFEVFWIYLAFVQDVVAILHFYLEYAVVEDILLFDDYWGIGGALTPFTGSLAQEQLVDRIAVRFSGAR